MAAPIFTAAGLGIADLRRYYEAVAPEILPHLRDRPLTLVQCFGSLGRCRYARHARSDWAPGVVRRVRIQEQTKLGEYLVVDDAASLVALVDARVVELHPWGSRCADLERPDRLVFDLDPGPEVAFGDVVRAARLLRDVLRSIGLASWPKTTGGTGLHVVVPLAPSLRWPEALALSRAVAAAVVREGPRLYTLEFARAGRERKILVDYKRNHRTATAVAAWSARARPDASVSVPVAWDELGPRLDPARFTIATVPARLRRLRRDLWEGFAEAAPRLPAQDGAPRPREPAQAVLARPVRDVLGARRAGSAHSTGPSGRRAP